MKHIEKGGMEGAECHDGVAAPAPLAESRPALRGDRDSGEPRPVSRQAARQAVAGIDAGHRWRDILIQVVLITVSVIVALAFDGLAAMWGHRVLVNEARANLATEIQDNRKELELVLRRMAETDEQLKRALKAVASRLDGQQSGDGEPHSASARDSPSFSRRAVSPRKRPARSP